MPHLLMSAWDTGIAARCYWQTDDPTATPTTTDTTPNNTGALQKPYTIERRVGPVEAYRMSAWDTGLAARCYWIQTDPAAVPGTTDTTPNNSGALQTPYTVEGTLFIHEPVVDGLALHLSEAGLSNYAPGGSSGPWLNGCTSGMANGVVSGHAPSVTVVDGERVASFNGTTGYVELPDLSAWTEGSLFIVMRQAAAPPAAGNVGAWFLGGAALNSQMPDGSEVPKDAFGSTTLHTMASMAAVPYTDWFLYTARSRANDWRGYIASGVVALLDTTNTVAFPSAPELGRSAVGPNNYFAGDVAEVLLFNRFLEPLEHDNISAFLSAQYGLPGMRQWLRSESLPTDMATLRVWSDDSHRGNEATQETAGYRPAIGELGFSPAAVFDGSDDSLRTEFTPGEAPGSGTGSFTVFVVVRVDTVGAGDRTIFTVSRAGNNYYQLIAKSPGYVLFQRRTDISNEWVSGDPFVPGAPFVCAARVNGETGDATLWVGSSGSPDTNTFTLSNAIGDLDVLAWGALLTGSADTTPGYILDGAIAHGEVYDIAMSDAAIAQHIAELEDEYIAPTAPSVGMLAWYKEDGLPASGAIATWSDSSGNGNDATQSDSGRQMTVATNAVTGLRAASSDGNDYFLSGAVASACSGAEWTIIVAFQRDNITNRNGLFGAAGGGESVWCREIGAASLGQSSLSQNLVDDIVGTSRSVVAVRFIGGIAEKWRDGALVGSIAGVARPLVTDGVLGAIRTGTTTFDFLSGDLFESVIYDRALTDRELGRTMTYLCDRHHVPMPVLLALPTGLPSSGSIAEWSTAKGPPLLQATGSAQPTVTTLNGFKSASFDSGDSMISALRIGSGKAPFTLLAAGKRTQALSDTPLVEMQTSGGTWVSRMTITAGGAVAASRRNADTTGEASATTGDAIASDAVVVASCRYDGTDLAARLNGGTVATAASAASSGTVTSAVFGQGITRSEIRAYREALTDEQRDAIDADMRARWGV